MKGRARGARRRLAGLDAGGEGGELGRVQAGEVHAGCRGDVYEQEVLAGEIEREVLVRLEEAQLADALSADAAGGKVGDAAVFELDADVSDVGLRGQHGEANGAQLAHGRVDEGEHDVEVVDHEVEHDVDIERTRGEDAEAVGLKEHGPVEVRAGGEDGGVKALKVTGLHESAVPGGKREDSVSLLEGGGERFFDEAVDASGKQGCGGGGVGMGRNADGSGVYRADAGEAGLDGRIGRDAEVGCGPLPSCRVGVDDGRQGERKGRPAPTRDRREDGCIRRLRRRRPGRAEMRWCLSRWCSSRRAQALAAGVDPLGVALLVMGDSTAWRQRV